GIGNEGREVAEGGALAVQPEDVALRDRHEEARAVLGGDLADERQRLRLARGCDPAAAEGGGAEPDALGAPRDPVHRDAPLAELPEDGEPDRGVDTEEHDRRGGGPVGPPWASPPQPPSRVRLSARRMIRGSLIPRPRSQRLVAWAASMAWMRARATPRCTRPASRMRRSPSKKSTRPRARAPSTKSAVSGPGSVQRVVMGAAAR